MHVAKRRLTLVALAIASGIAIQGPVMAENAPIQTSQANSAAPSMVQLPNFTQLVKKVSPAVVNISTVREEKSPSFQMGGDPGQLPDIIRQFFGNQLPPGFGGFPGMGGADPQTEELHSLGSGFVISPDGYILTNAHVVAGAQTIRVRFNDRRNVAAKLIGMDRKTDVALIKVNLKNLPTVQIGNSDKLQTGEWMVAIGSPFGFDSSVTQGIVSAINRTLPDDSYVPFIQTDVPINPGNSGGPLLNLQGQVVGINSQIYTQSGGYMGLSFAVPINVAMDVANQIKKDGHVTRGYLGVAIQGVSPDLASSFGLKNTQGALIAQLSPHSPGGKAGLQPGDIVTAVNGHTVDTPDDLPRLIGAMQPGQTAQLTIIRDGQTKSISATLGDWPKSSQEETTSPHQSSHKSRLGVTVSPLNDSQLKSADVPNGVVVRQVTPNSIGDKAGLQPGDIIIEVNRQEISSVDQLRSVVAALPKHRPIAMRVARGNQQMFIAIRMDGKMDDSDYDSE